MENEPTDLFLPEHRNTNHNNQFTAEDTNKPLLQCKYCPKKYKVLGTLKKHEEWCPQKKDMLAEGKDRTNRNGSKESEGSKIKACKQCGQTFKYKKILQKHEAMHQSNSPHWCKMCMENFPSYEEKVLHKMNKHPTTKDKKRKCRICPSVNFGSEEEYLYHITEVHKGKYDDYYMCSDCGKQFKTKSELTHHNNSKCGTIKQYKCKVCEQELMTAGSLHNHMLRHTGERCCMCGYCGKMFLTSGQLKVHERTHTQEKAFVCNVCGKGFCHRQSLITHSTLHTGVKPYQCDNCGQSFSCVGNLIKHRKTHAETCGATPLTTHRVNNPSTKMKVKINTPKNSKLKTIRKEQEVQEKIEKYKQTFAHRPSTSENECNQSNGSSDDKYVVSSQNSDYSSYRRNEDKTVAGGNVPACEFQMKNETVNDISKGFMQKSVFDLNSQVNKNYINNSSEIKPPNGCELDFFKVEGYSSKFPIQEENFITNSITTAELQMQFNLPAVNNPVGFNSANPTSQPPTEVEVNLPIVDINNTVSFEDVNLSKNNQSAIVKEPEIYPSQTNFDGADNYYMDEDHNDNYDSEICEDLKINEEIAGKKLKKSLVKDGLKRRKDSKEQLTGTEFAEFISQKRFNGTTEGSCQYCKKSYANLRWLFKHEKGHEKKFDQIETQSENPHRCSCCKQAFQTREDCRAHQQNVHADILTCQECDKLFSNVDSLRSHQNIFHKGLPRKVYVYVCDKCGIQFRQKASLVHHEKSNCGAGPVYECHVCGKGFNSMHTRRSHLRIHDPKKRFLCKFCGKSFRWKGQLKIHERSHTGEKPFKCLYCPKAFAYRESLVTHSSLHTGIKPHLCQACGSRFSCIGNLIKHRGTHASTCGLWYSKNQ